MAASGALGTAVLRLQLAAALDIGQDGGEGVAWGRVGGTRTRDHSRHIELDREDAVAAMLAACDFHPRHETVPVEESFGRTLAACALAQVTLPNCLT